MRRSSFAEFHCSLARALEVAGDWWTPLLLRDLFLGADRFEDLVVDLGISRNLLTTRLGELIENGLVVTEPYCEHPPRHRYVLTEKGKSLVPIFAALTAWGDRWETPPGGPPLEFRHGRHHCDPTVTCRHCGEELTADKLGTRTGPGARRAKGTLRVGDMMHGHGDPVDGC